RKKSDLLRGALPSRDREERRAHRLSLGPHAQARDARLGSRHGDGRIGVPPTLISFHGTMVPKLLPSGTRGPARALSPCSGMGPDRRHMMRIRILLALLAATAIAPSAAFAQGNTVGGAIGGAAIGGVVGGPVGAVVGAGVGGTVGAATE